MTSLPSHTQYPVARPYLDVKDRQGVMNVLKSGMLSLGPRYQEFERSMASYAGTRYAVAVANGTCGLHLVVRSLGLKAGDEVITSPFSFVSSSNVLLYENVKPVFVDIEETTYNMDPAKIEAAITRRTKAILVVHIFGQPATMAPILRIAKRHHLAVLEDSCESLGARYRNRMTGTFGEAGVYAFYPNKQMTTGEGGIIVTNNRTIAQLCQSLRNQGRNASGDWLLHERLGYNYRMDEMSASLGVTQLNKLSWMISQKKKIATWYQQALKGHPAIITPKIAPERTHSWFVYVIRITNGRRNRIMAQLTKKGVQTKPYLPVIHLQPFMRKQFHFRPGDFPIAEKISSQTLALPFYIGLTRRDIHSISNQIKELV